MGTPTAFTPYYGTGQVVTTGAASASVAVGVNSQSICLTNMGANYCYVRTGDSAVTATAADYIVPAGGQVVIGKPAEHTHVAYLQRTGSTTLGIIGGEGL